MERSALVRRVAPIAVFAAVLGGLAALSVRNDDGPARNGSQRSLDRLPLAARNAGGAEGAPQDARTGASTADMRYWAGRIVIPDALLQGLPAEGPVHTVSRDDVPVDRIAALARALGLVGVVKTDNEGWYVEGDEQTLRVYKQAGTPWHLSSEKRVVVAEPAEPVSPEPRPAPEDDPDATGGDTPVSSEPCDEKCQVDPAPPPDCPQPADGTEPACVRPEPSRPPQPSDAEAKAAAQRVFDAAGLTGYTVTVNDAWSGKEVVASPVVGGLPTVGFDTRVTVLLGGTVSYAYGHLGAATLKGDYPLLAPRDAVDREGPYGAPRAMDDVACEAEPCPTPEPREAKKLRLGLLFMPSYDPAEGAFLAPAWLLTFGEGPWEQPVLALPDRYLATPPPASDQPAPMPPDGGSVDSGSGGGTSGSTGTSK